MPNPSLMQLLLSAIGGFAVGAPVWYWVTWQFFPRIVEREPGAPEFEPSYAWEQREPVLVRSFPIGIETKSPETVQSVQFRRTGTWLDNAEAGNLARLILASGQPPEGVKLTHALLKGHGFTADARRRDLLEQIVARGKGYRKGTTGGKLTVVLKAEVAARHVAKCRERGLVWGEGKDASD